MRLPVLEELPTSKDMTEEFRGYNKNIRNATNEWYDEQNMSTDFYPVASPRGKRSLQRQDTEVILVPEISTDNGYTTKELKATNTAAIGYINNGLKSLSVIQEKFSAAGYLDKGMVFVDGEKVVGQSRVTPKHNVVCSVDVDWGSGTFEPEEDNVFFTLTAENEGLKNLGIVVGDNVVLAFKYDDDTETYGYSVLGDVTVYNGSTTLTVGMETAPFGEIEGDNIPVTIYNETAITALKEEASSINHEGKKQIVKMGSYAFVAPDGVVYETNNTEALMPVYRVEEEVTARDVTFATVVRKDDKYSLVPSYINSISKKVYRYEENQIQYYIQDSATWVNQPTYLYIYKKNESNTFGNLKEGDAIEISRNLSGYKSDVYQTLDAYYGGIFSGDKSANAVVIERGRFKKGTYPIDDEKQPQTPFTDDTDYVLIEGFMVGYKEGATVTESSSYGAIVFEMTTLGENNNHITIKRKKPDIPSLACESQNRIWTCDKEGHEIYASALGDPYNFYNYSGLATDSYAVNVGTEGKFTGCVNYLGNPLFFKENALHKIGGSYPTNAGQFDGGSYTVTTITDFKGVEEGSEKSFAIIDNILYYKSAEGIVAYDGSSTALVSDQLGKEKYKNAVAGSTGSKYYVSMEDSNDVNHLFVFDTKTGMWSREDNTKALQFLKVGTELIYYDLTRKAVYSVADTDVFGFEDFTVEDNIEWHCETGNYGYSFPNNKYLSRFQVRMQIADNAKAAIFVQYNSDGVWHKAGAMESKGINTYLLPIIPVRCDHMKLRFEGKGDVKILSIAKIYEEGGDVV